MYVVHIVPFKNVYYSEEYELCRTDTGDVFADIFRSPHSQEHGVLSALFQSVDPVKTAQNVKSVCTF